MKILITGCSFIGFNVANHLLTKKYKIIGIDNFDNCIHLHIKKEFNN